MSDPKYGEPVDETTPDAGRHGVDDVVGSANEGLAEAEAARRAPVADDRPVPAATSDDAPADAPETPASADRDFAFTDRGSDLSLDYDRYTETSATPATPVSSEPLYRPELADETGADRDTDVTTTPPAADRDTAVTTSPPAAAPMASEPASPAVQPIFVQAPEAPRPRGNRGAVAAIGLLAALVFALISLLAAVGLVAVADDVTVEGLLDATLSVVTTAAFWVPVAVFYLAFCLLGAFINRGRWGLWVILGLLVGLASYGGHLLGQLFAAPFWTLTASQGAQLVEEQLLAPLAIVALVAGREITIWFGAWVAARGRRVTELNAEAQREYERTLEAGPQLHRA